MTRAPPLKHGKLDCTDYGFTFLSHTRRSPNILAIELGVQPRRTPAGRISKK
jgi:hypothetical protein